MDEFGIRKLTPLVLEFIPRLPPIRPMTSKEVKRVYHRYGPRSQSASARRQREEHDRRLDEAEARRQAKEEEKVKRLEDRERRAERARVRREKKRVAEEATERERRRRGELKESPWVKPGQKRISSFLVAERGREDD